MTSVKVWGDPPKLKDARWMDLRRRGMGRKQSAGAAVQRERNSKGSSMIKSKILLVIPLVATLGGAVVGGCDSSPIATGGSGGQGGSVSAGGGSGGNGGSIETGGGSGGEGGVGGAGGAALATSHRITIVGSGT